VTVTLSKPKRKLTLVSVRRVYRCKEYPQWRIEFVHYSVGEDCDDPYPDRWQVWHALPQEEGPPLDCLISEHRNRCAAIKAMGKSIREYQRPRRRGRA
jgi:transposase-like protein